MLLCLCDGKCFCLLLLTSLAALWDFSLGQIPNRLLAVFWLLGFSWDPDPSYFLRGGVTILILSPLIRLGMLGAGDGKLLGVLGCYLGYRDVLFLFFLSCLYGVAGAAAVRRRKGFWKARIHCFFRYIHEMIARKEVLPYPAREDPQARLPLALPILGGVWTILLLAAG